ncbi:MAG: tRNA lysidine(34) synthetase TilS [Verrucomicrobia bacterium]|nr:tRNA lysidine(34) synthetase TilS [Verrucomicrobiota bacterium]
MSELLDHVERSIQARQLFRPRQRILVAVSGGVDSIVLLHLLHALAGKQGWQLVAAHFNHQLRGQSSAADERLVRRAAQRLKLPLMDGRADVREFARTRKLSLEMAARELRHSFLARSARQRRIPSIALAHHADDQLELFFLRLLRGSGGEGLAGMKWRNSSPNDPDIELVRPLMDQPKAELLEFAAEHGIRYREDASNAVLDFQRNRVRHELLPLLRRKYQPALDKTISRVMEIVGADAEFTAQAAQEWLRGVASPKAEERLPAVIPAVKSEHVEDSLGRLLFGKEGVRKRLLFVNLPVAVQRRCVQLQLVRQGVSPDYELVEQLRVKADQPVAISRAQATRRTRAELADQTPLADKSCQMGREGDVKGTGGAPAPLCAVRDRSGFVSLRVSEPAEFRSGSTVLALVGKTGGVEFGGVRIRWKIGSRKALGLRKAGVQKEFFDADKVGSQVRLRHWQPGDRFQPIGMAVPVKLQDFFTNQKVPRDRRRQLIVATTAHGEVFWVEGMRISERFKLVNQTIRSLQWRWKRF